MSAWREGSLGFVPSFPRASISNDVAAAAAAVAAAGVYDDMESNDDHYISLQLP